MAPTSGAQSETLDIMHRFMKHAEEMLEMWPERLVDSKIQEKANA